MVWDEPLDPLAHLIEAKRTLDESLPPDSERMVRLEMGIETIQWLKMTLEQGHSPLVGITGIPIEEVDDVGLYQIRVIYADGHEEMIG